MDGPTGAALMARGCLPHRHDNYLKSGCRGGRTRSPMAGMRRCCARPKHSGNQQRVESHGRGTDAVAELHNE